MAVGDIVVAPGRGGASFRIVTKETATQQELVWRSLDGASYNMRTVDRSTTTVRHAAGSERARAIVASVVESAEGRTLRNKGTLLAKLERATAANAAAAEAAAPTRTAGSPGASGTGDS